MLQLLVDEFECKLKATHEKGKRSDDNPEGNETSSTSFTSLVKDANNTFGTPEPTQGTHSKCMYVLHVHVCTVYIHLCRFQL